MGGLADWDSFYVIVGSAAGGLIGLQFVVMTLLAARPPADATAGAAFATPTIVHFSVTLFVSALTRVPLLIGIHNAWDAVSYHVLFRLSRKEKPE